MAKAKPGRYTRPMKSELNRVCLKGRASDEDVLTAVCLSLGAQGVEVVDHEIDAAIPVDETCIVAWHGSEQTHDQLHAAYSERCFVPVTIEINAQALDTWRSDLSKSGPQYIGSRFIISEEDLEQPRHRVIRIKQGLGFGGGHSDDPSLCRWYGNGVQPRTVHSWS